MIQVLRYGLKYCVVWCLCFLSVVWRSPPYKNSACFVRTTLSEAVRFANVTTKVCLTYKLKE